MKSRQLIAPWWHTFVLVAALIVLSLANARTPPLASDRTRLVAYVLTVLVEALMVGFVWFGLRLRRHGLRTVLGAMDRSALAIGRDVALAVGFLVVANVVTGLVATLLRARTDVALRDLLPHTPIDLWVFVLVVVAAAVCEEIVFRGYLLKQLEALTGSVALAVVLQAIVFGGSHGYQGLRSMLNIAVYGCLLGCLAAWRRSLRPGILAHALQDALAGLLASRMLR